MRKATAYEAADYLGVGYHKVIAMAASREIPAAKLGNVWIFDLDLIDEHLKKKMLESVEQPQKQSYPNLRASGGLLIEAHKHRRA